MYTAGTKEYAEEVCKNLDENNTIIKRIFSRQVCVKKYNLLLIMLSKRELSSCFKCTCVII